MAFIKSQFLKGAGIRLPDVAVPLGTYTGWNLRTATSGPEGILTRLDGMYLPFATTKQQRLAQNDQVKLKKFQLSTAIPL